MKLYFAPLACSLACRIALDEARLAADFEEVVLSTKTMKRDGSDFRAINPKGQVPALVRDDGSLLTEGVVVLQWIADQAPERGLAPPPGSEARLALQAWLNMIAGELHAGGFVPQMHPAAPPEARAFARLRIGERYALVAAHLAGRDWLMDRFTVADAYLLAVLNWTEHAGMDLNDWPVLAAWRARVRQRPSVARAMATELALRQAA